MAEQDDRTSMKRWWNENTTQQLINELRKNYNLYRSGHIRKKTLWQKIADELNQQGAEFSAEQVENKYKSLLRSYRNSCGMKSRTAGKCFKYENELQDIFMLDTNLKNKSENDEDPLEYVMEQDLQDSVEVPNDDNVFEEVLIEEQDMHANYTRRPIPQVQEEAQTDNLFDDEDLVIEEPRIRTNYVRRQIPQIPRVNRVKYRVIKKTKSSVDVLLEIKELMKKVELRNQIRHEQNLKIQMERNKILKKKNEIMEQMLKNNVTTI